MKRLFLPVVLIALVAAACDQATTDPLVEAPEEAAFKKAKSADHAGEAVSDYLREVNERLAAQGLGFAVDRAELSVSPDGSPDQALVVYANHRTLRLDSKWVPGDDRRGADGNNLTYLNYGLFMPANGTIDAEPEIDASFDSWADVSCGHVPLVKRDDTGEWPSAVLTFNGIVGNPFVADIVTIGFLPGFIFDLVLGPGASSNVLGVTFTFVFGSYDSEGNFTPSDVDSNGRTDTALKEVWYNDQFLWTDTGTGDNVDIQTVAFHENGHALELGHFGKVAVNTSSGKLQVSPRAAMNAFILGTLRSPLGTDNAAYCGNWGSWPN